MTAVKKRKYGSTFVFLFVLIKSCYSKKLFKYKNWLEVFVGRSWPMAKIEIQHTIFKVCHRHKFDEFNQWES